MQRQYYVRAAIALNNMAVTLMVQLRCHSRAHLVLKDAIAVLRQSSSMERMKNLAQKNPNLVLSRECSLIAIMEHRLHRASQWIISGEMHSSRQVKLPMQILTDDPTSANVSVHQYKFVATPAARFIRFDYSDSEELDEDRVTAIVTYNLGVSFVCHSQLAAWSTKRSHKLLSHAAKVLRVASNIVRRIDDDEKEERMLFTSLLIETLLVQTLVPIGEVNEARVRLAALRSTARHLDSYCHVLRLMQESGGLVGAAAA